VNSLDIKKIIFCVSASMGGGTVENEQDDTEAAAQAIETDSEVQSCSHATVS